MCASWKQSESLSFTVFDCNYIFFFTLVTIEVFQHVNKDIREVKYHVYVKWQTRICTGWPSFLFTCCSLFITSTPKLVGFTQFFIHKNCFELFLSAHFQLWEFINLNLTFAFAVYVKLKLSINPLSPNSDQQQFSPNNIHMLPSEMVMTVNKMIT